MNELFSNMDFGNQFNRRDSNSKVIYDASDSEHEEGQFIISQPSPSTLYEAYICQQTIPLTFLFFIFISISVSLVLNYECILCIHGPSGDADEAAVLAWKKAHPNRRKSVLNAGIPSHPQNNAAKPNLNVQIPFDNNNNKSEAAPNNPFETFGNPFTPMQPSDPNNPFASPGSKAFNEPLPPTPKSPDSLILSPHRGSVPSFAQRLNEMDDENKEGPEPPPITPQGMDVQAQHLVKAFQGHLKPLSKGLSRVI